MSDPDSLEYQDYIAKVIAECEPILERARAEGLTGVLLIGGYDVLKQTPHNQWHIFGNPQTVYGQVWEFQQLRAACIRGTAMVLGNDELEEEDE